MALFCDKCGKPTVIGHSCKPYIWGISNVSNLPVTNPSTEFDEELSLIWDEIDLNTPKESFKEAIKVAVDKYVIEADVAISRKLSKNTVDWLEGRQFQIDKSRKSLWGE